MFTEQIALFERFLIAVGTTWSDDQQGLLLEAATRLRQVEYSFERARLAAEEHYSLWKNASRNAGERNRLAVRDEGQPDDHHRRFWQLQFEVRFYTESFYYFASRLQKILGGKELRLPGFAFQPVAGIRIVRNDLVEHPEGKRSRVFTGGTEIATGPFNVWLKVPNATRSIDPGLLSNATALRDQLDKTLGAALTIALSNEEL